MTMGEVLERIEEIAVEARDYDEDACESGCLAGWAAERVAQKLEVLVMRVRLGIGETS